MEPKILNHFEVKKLLPDRDPWGHKGTFGRVLLLCGSRGFTGAAYLAAMGALRCGAGLVFLGVPECIYQIEAVKLNEPVVFPLPEDQGKKFRALWDEFEEGQTPEARFAVAMDRTQPLVLHDLAEGKAWVENGINLAQVTKRVSKIAKASETLYEFAYENIVVPHVERGNIKQ